MTPYTLVRHSIICVQTVRLAGSHALPCYQAWWAKRHPNVHHVPDLERVPFTGKVTLDELAVVIQGLAATNGAFQNVISAFLHWRHINRPTTFYGWYDTADQPIDKPTFDPPHDTACPYCLMALTADDIRCHSLMLANGATRSYFYRTQDM